MAICPVSLHASPSNGLPQLAHSLQQISTRSLSRSDVLPPHVGRYGGAYDPYGDDDYYYDRNG